MWELKVVRERRGGYGLAGSPVAGSEQIFRTFRDRFLKLDREEFIAVLLDGKGRVMGFNTVSVGSLTASLVHPREVFKAAIIANAATLILVHNHPSGDPEPSAEDVALTRRLKEAGDLLGIRILDHVVIGDDRYVSFVDTGRF